MQENKSQGWMTAVGMGLIFLLGLTWLQMFAPKPPEKTPEMIAQDSLAALQATQNQPVAAPGQAAAGPVQAAGPLPDSLKNRELVGQFGDFAAAGAGSETFETLENEFLKITFTSKGGRIKEVLVKNFKRAADDGKGNETRSPLRLLEDEKNRFDLSLPVASARGGFVHSSDLFYAVSKGANSVSFKADAGNGRFLEQTWTLSPDNYFIDFTVNLNNLNNGVLANGATSIRLDWVNYLDKLEKNYEYESQYSSIYFRVNEEDPDYCDCRQSETQEFADQPLKWVSHSNQFFNSTLFAEAGSFKNARLETMMLDAKGDDLKCLKSQFDLPLTAGGNEKMAFKMYIGPNEFGRLQSAGQKFEDIIPFGSSIFGSINRWVIHPLFTFLMGIFGSAGICILLLTLLVKLAVYPLTWKMVHSQAKQTALKPQMDALKKKFGDDQQKMSMESMKLYQEYGVNPVGGCMPMLLQMPIWLALYKFFPASIEFRQQSFLWATDLSSYDSPIHLPFEVPFLGSHISLFTLIWTVTTLWYTWYTMKQMKDTMANNPQMEMMKYMQYAMPIIFFFFFNKFASGLSAYLSFSNLLNIGQTIVTKNYFINHEKIRAELDAKKSKPKPTTGWRAKLDQAMQDSQRMQAEKEKAKKKK